MGGSGPREGGTPQLSQMGCDLKLPSVACDIWPRFNSDFNFTNDSKSPGGGGSWAELWGDVIPAISSGGSCEAEHFVEIDVESSDEDGRVALKRRSLKSGPIPWLIISGLRGSPHLRSPKSVDFL